MTRARAARALLVACLVLACGGASSNGVVKRPSTFVAPKSMRVIREPDHAALAVVSREGDPSGAVAAFISTSGIAPARGAVVPVALAGLFASRSSARVTPQADGVRISLPAHDASELVRLAATLSEPVTNVTDTTGVKRKIAALRAIARTAPEAAVIATCEGALAAPSDATPPTNEELEAWRAAAITTARVAFGAVAVNVQSAPAVAHAVPPSVSNATPPAELAVYEAPGEIAPQAALVSLVWRGGLQRLGAAKALGATSSRLSAMLAATDSSAQLRSASAALSADGACLALRMQVDADAATSAGAARIASILELAKTTAHDAIAESDVDTIAPSDASDAAEQAALIALASSVDAREEVPRAIVGLAAASPAARDALGRAFADAAKAWDVRAIETKSRLERGQPATWMLLASTCGVAGETDGDAGASAAFAVTAAASARARGLDAEAWIASDGVGVIASSTNVHALADVLARSFVVDPLEGARAAQGKLLDSARPGLATLAEAIAPGRPSTALPTGTPFALLRASDAVIGARADALRRGPLRVAVIANGDARDADDAAARVDRWVLREGARACPTSATTRAPKPGTYAVVTEDGTSEAYVAAMSGDAENEAAALAHALDGDGGLLDKALGDGVAREFGARVLGPPGARALVVHVAAPVSALDNAVAQVRALLDRVRQGNVADAELAKGKERADASRAAKLRDPRERLVALYRNETAAAEATPERVRAAAAQMLRDDALVIIAARPRPAQKRTP